MPITFVNVGAAVYSSGGTTGTIYPTLPSGLQVGDLVLVFVTGRGNHNFTSTVLGRQWQYSHASSGINKIALFYKFYQTGDGNPDINWTGGGTSQTVIAQACAFRGVSTTTPFGVIGASSSNASQANIGPIGGISGVPAGDPIIVFGHRADDWTSVATLSGDGLTWYEIGEPKTSSGNDAGEVWDYAFSAGLSVTSKTFTVTGGLVQTGMGIMQSLKAAVITTGWRKLQYYTEPPTTGAFNKLKCAVEPPVSGAFNKLLYDGE